MVESPLEMTPKAEAQCEICARPLTYVATIRGIGLRPKVTVFRCDHCKRIETEPALTGGCGVRSKTAS